ncbi:uncharacterized protein LOC127011080 [Drosophila biarmipes]|uniref:uncharacterized protein LOC127011080 n=1 Tax=Drosophila biarmipes TaxID=125945 RepID=UPI0007E82A54|nr:uncharacterized protein LOC127011080 [Drosophila biarmipes]
MQSAEICISLLRVQTWALSHSRVQPAGQEQRADKSPDIRTSSSPKSARQELQQQQGFANCLLFSYVYNRNEDNHFGAAVFGLLSLRHRLQLQLAERPTLRMRIIRSRQ